MSSVIHGRPRSPLARRGGERRDRLVTTDDAAAQWQRLPLRGSPTGCGWTAEGSASDGSRPPRRGVPGEQRRSAADRAGGPPAGSDPVATRLPAPIPLPPSVSSGRGSGVRWRRRPDQGAGGGGGEDEDEAQAESMHNTKKIAASNSSTSVTLEEERSRIDRCFCSPLVHSHTKSRDGRLGDRISHGAATARGEE